MLRAGFAVLGVLVCASGCFSPRPSTLDPVIRQVAGAAEASYQRGEVERASALYQRALDRARLIDDRGETARNAYNLALCRTVQGDLPGARSLLDQAGALAGPETVESARILLAQAEVARLAGDPAGSARFAYQAEASGADRDGVIQAAVLQGEAELAAGQSQRARDQYQRAESRMRSSTPALLKARSAALAIGLVQAGVLAGDAAVLQVRRAAWLKQAGQFSMMADALGDAAQRFEQQSKWAEAFACRIRAAQSHLAAGRRDVAGAMLKAAAELAGRTGHAGDRALVEGLMGDLK